IEARLHSRVARLVRLPQFEGSADRGQCLCGQAQTAQLSLKVRKIHVSRAPVRRLIQLSRPPAGETSAFRRSRSSASVCLAQAGRRDVAPGCEKCAPQSDFVGCRQMNGGPALASPAALHWLKDARLSRSQHLLLLIRQLDDGAIVLWQGREDLVADPE